MSGCLLVAVMILSAPAFAGSFSVSPLRLDLDSRNKSGAITIRNEGEHDLRVQIALYEWTQDADGKDDYHRSDDLLYFPRLANIGAGDSRVVRVGLQRVSQARHEKAYRLFVEELPEPVPQQGMALGIAVRFGVPLFVSPAEVKAAGRIEAIEMQGGELRIRVRNSGNVHFRIASIEAASGDRYAERITGWYLLPGAAREYVMSVPEALCAELGRVAIKVETDRLDLDGALDVTPDMCKP
jgi:fimbrial chaperone protein